MEQNSVPRGKLEAARSAGAHDQFITFVAEYPDSRVADTLDLAISMDALDDFKGISGSFEWALWDRGASACSNADPKHRKMLRELFDYDDLPKMWRDK